MSSLSTQFHYYADDTPLYVQLISSQPSFLASLEACAFTAVCQRTCFNETQIKKTFSCLVLSVPDTIFFTVWAFCVLSDCELWFDAQVKFVFHPGFMQLAPISKIKYSSHIIKILLESLKPFSLHIYTTVAPVLMSQQEHTTSSAVTRLTYYRYKGILTHPSSFICTSLTIKFRIHFKIVISKFWIDFLDWHQTSSVKFLDEKGKR